jgi:hypothetical protein
MRPKHVLNNTVIVKNLRTVAARVAMVDAAAGVPGRTFVIPRSVATIFLIPPYWEFAASNAIYKVAKLTKIAAIFGQTNASMARARQVTDSVEIFKCLGARSFRSQVDRQRWRFFVFLLRFLQHMPQTSNGPTATGYR